MDELDTDTWGLPQNVSQALIGPNNHIMVMWWQTLSQSIDCPQITMSESSFKRADIIKLCTECHPKLVPIADHHMCDQFSKQNLVYRFMGPMWQWAKTLVHKLHVFCSVTTLCSVDLISQSTYALPVLPEANFDHCALCFVLCTTLSKLCRSDFTIYALPVLPEANFDHCALCSVQHFPSRLSAVGDPSPSISMA